VGPECNLNVSTNNRAPQLTWHISTLILSERANLLIENTAEFAYDGSEIAAPTKAIHTINRFRTLMRNLCQHCDKLEPVMNLFK
jgi:hypothetical protein